eukprot:COSAG05_NODE_19440_length_292_cov_1.792746_1_plen_20_part_10
MAVITIAAMGRFPTIAWGVG